MRIYIYIYIYVGGVGELLHLQECTSKGIRRQGVVSKHRSSLQKALVLKHSLLHLGDSKNDVRGYCLDIPRFEESLND